MRILLASSEVHPFSKTGGLADVVGALAKSLAAAGHRVGVVSPLYRGVRESFPNIAPAELALIDLPLGGRRVQAQVWTLSAGPHLTYYFIRQENFFERPELYQEQGHDYPDNVDRFTYFSKCVAYLARHLSWQPELVHNNDWQTGLVPLFLRHQSLHDGWTNPPRTVLTIHNLAYQGNFPAATFGLTNLPLTYFHPSAVEYWGGMNFLKTGIVFSDVITTVSPRYAREILTEPFGCGLDGVLRQRQHSVFGILNGVDYEEWQTVNNPFLKQLYSTASLRGKAAGKLELQQELGLPVTARVPLFCTISRLVEQKGVDILLAALTSLLPQHDLQFALLGSGPPQHEAAFAELHRRFPGKVAVHLGFNQGLSHRMEAGGDFFLMPSRFEPCGLNQMYSQRYGTIPIVRITGGLDDSVVDATENAAGATGIKFGDYSAANLAAAITRALELFRNAKLLRQYRLNGMKADFSWERTSEQYLRIYELALGK